MRWLVRWKAAHLRREVLAEVRAGLGESHRRVLMISPTSYEEKRGGRQGDVAKHCWWAIGPLRGAHATSRGAGGDDSEGRNRSPQYLNCIHPIG